MGAGRPAGQDHRLGGVGVQHLLDLVVGMDLAIDAVLTQASGDQLGHLAAEIDDQDALVVGFKKLGHGGGLGHRSV